MTRPDSLCVRHVARNFAGLWAVKDASLDLHRGSIHALIGTNGAGKTTLLNVLSGELKPTRGSIFYGQQDITAWDQVRRAHLGLGRSFQKCSVFENLSVLENCRLASQARSGLHVLGLAQCSLTRLAAEEVLEKVGLQDKSTHLAYQLAHGEKRLLEMALCLALQPKILLLDEPLAGLALHETPMILQLLSDLRHDHAILLVEHDMSAVFQVADTLTVMVDGEVIASGKPDVVRQLTSVKRAYLGDEV
ncbi:MAG: ABC transporter ATP-binding protein [Gammaproteobacteria bacterium]|nr:ABC transporter ATP-binding protein [Gammaproteobacteria bacterium]